MSEQKKPYWQLLQDPRWQKKRLEVMNRAEFRCEACGDDKETLNVHHGYYEKGLMPWDYETRTLWCLCEECHMFAHEYLKGIQKHIACLPVGRLVCGEIFDKIVDIHWNPESNVSLWIKNMTPRVERLRAEIEALETAKKAKETGTGEGVAQ